MDSREKLSPNPASPGKKNILLTGALIALICVLLLWSWWMLSQLPMLSPIAAGQAHDHASRRAMFPFISALSLLVVAAAMLGAVVVPHAFNTSLAPFSNEGRSSLDWAATFAGAMLFAALALGVASVFKNVVHPDWSSLTAGVFDLAEKAAGVLVAALGVSLPLGVLTAKLTNKCLSTAP